MKSPREVLADEYHEEKMKFIRGLPRIPERMRRHNRSSEVFFGASGVGCVWDTVDTFNYINGRRAAIVTDSWRVSTPQSEAAWEGRR